MNDRTNSADLAPGHAAPTAARTNLADIIWRTAELLRGAFREPEYRRVILPFTILRRLDCLLEPTKDAVLAKHREISKKNYDPKLFLGSITGFPFWNHSAFTVKGLLQAPDEIRDNLEDMVNGFSPNVRRIFDKFGFMATVDKLREKGRLYYVVKAFAAVPMDQKSVSGHDMGKAFEELLRRFNDTSPAGEQYTPRDVIHLMVDILFDGDDEMLAVPGAIRTMYDQTAGTGGMLSEGQEKVQLLNPNAKLRLFGQELEDETYAICMSDMLIRGQNPEDIKLGDTLSDDQHPNERFDYQLSNPPYGVEWKPAQEDVEKEHAKGAAGRFGPGLPRISDGQMLFQLNAISKLRPYVNGEGGGKAGLVHNGSPLFTGDAGSGESEIRRFLLEKDLVDAIVALPTDMFYNTNIGTYLWFFTNRKPNARKGKVMLIDASNMGVLMKKNLGKKRFELSTDCQRRIVQAYHAFKDAQWSDATGGRKRGLKVKVLPTSHFMYRKVTIERPLRVRLEVTQEKVDAFVLSMGSKTKAPGKKDIEQQNVAAALVRMLKDGGEQTFMSMEAFTKALEAADAKNSKDAGLKPTGFKSKALEPARKALGVRDKKAAIVTDDKGKPLADSDLRDAEYIPFSFIAKHGNDVPNGVQAYFDAEVKPHWPDAWINETVLDEADEQIGAVGCEINFNREFYVYEAPRSREAIKHDIDVMEKRFMEMLKGVA
ncbi:MAG: SAM-dependent DNA methyltransferase [Hyphomicrobiales bacterium]|nr:MAG: SAM-dependent DNA methyltransferase [Hyphomicrobiales bacterium]